MTRLALDTAETPREGGQGDDGMNNGSWQQTKHIYDIAIVGNQVRLQWADDESRGFAVLANNKDQAHEIARQITRFAELLPEAASEAKGLESAGREAGQVAADEAAVTTAAGPWIRVDSGERPEDMDEVVAYGEERTVGGWYAGDDGSVHTDYDAVHLSQFSHWARINPPETRNG